jgi:phosphohistidine phosphatase SixA
MKKLFLITHGAYYGSKDSDLGLSYIGKQQAEQIAKNLGQHFGSGSNATVWASNANCVKETVEILRKTITLERYEFLENDFSEDAYIRLQSSLNGFMGDNLIVVCNEEWVRNFSKELGIELKGTVGYGNGVVIARDKCIPL